MTEEKRTQAQRIVDYIDKFGYITVGDINRKLMINAATARISDLRKMGFNIQDMYATSSTKSHPYKVYFRGPDEFNDFVEPQLNALAVKSGEFLKEI